MSKPNGSMRAVFYALAGNTTIAIIKFIVAFFTKSTAMLAESIHTTADCLNQIFLLIGDKRSKKAPTEWHAFGYKREAFFWSLLVAILLFFVGAAFSIYEGVHKLFFPEPLHNIYWIFLVLGASIIIEGKSFSVAFIEFRKKTNKKFVKAIEESTDTNLMVILLEDFAALAGLTIVMVTTVLSLFNPIFDAIGSILVGLLLVGVSYKLADEIRRLIIGESIPREDRNKIKDILNGYDLIEHINYVRTAVIGNDKYRVEISIGVDDFAHGHYIEDITDKMKTEIKEAIPEIEHIVIEIKDQNRSNN